MSKDAGKQPKNSRAAHLAAHQFKPGESGNPSGRPHGSISLVTLLKRKLAEVPPGEQRTYGEMLVEATVTDALAGDSQARKLAWEYVEGAAKQHVEIEDKRYSTPDEALAFVQGVLESALTRGAVGDSRRAH